VHRSRRNKAISITPFFAPFGSPSFPACLLWVHFSARVNKKRCVWASVCVHQKLLLKLSMKLSHLDTGEAVQTALLRDLVIVKIARSV
jgi:hypothetical protein